jgi:hypothetical protein
MATTEAATKSKSEHVGFLDSKQAYVRAMNADGVTVIEGTGDSLLQNETENAADLQSNVVRTMQSHCARGRQVSGGVR